MNCDRPHCTGQIDADGYCDVCGKKATQAGRLSQALDIGAADVPVDETVLTRRALTTRRTSTRRARTSDAIVNIPTVPPRDPASAVLANPEVPEERRYCAQCNGPVGRSRAGTPGRTEGFCPKCGHPFSFRPKLAAGDLVARQYDVAGCIAHGGLGWIYLAKDRNVEDRWVVLKGLLNTSDEDARGAALSEKRFLAGVNHPNIVKIYNFVEHGNDGYIVMEFVDGTSLRGLLEARRDANDGEFDPLPADHAIWYLLQILPALGYLHDLGLLFCDFKPDNVMQSGDSVKLIDLGGVYKADEPASAIFGTTGYQAPEIAQTGPTIASDLYTVARTLAVLCTDFRGYQNAYVSTLPRQGDVPLYARHDSLYRFLERATATNPDDRFQSADEMAAQLLGVLREVVAAQRQEPVAGRSTLFTGELRGDADAPAWTTLPALLVSADDPAAGLLATLGTIATGDVIDYLEHAPERTVEVELRLARTLIEEGRLDDARRTLDGVAANDPWEWRTDWYRGLAALRGGDPKRARGHFELVYRMVPGELAPKLAMARAAEEAGDFATGARWSDIVSRTDPAFTTAAVCLARCRLALGDRPGAIDAYDRVPGTSSAYVDAQIAKAKTILHRLDCEEAGTGVEIEHTTDDIVRAAEVVDRLPLGAEQQARLRAEVLECALDVTRRDVIAANGSAPMIFTYPLNEHGVRVGLEATYRSLARQAHTTSERIQLVDLANRVRPRTIV